MLTNEPTEFCCIYRMGLWNQSAADVEAHMDQKGNA